MAKISVIIPIYNASQYLNKCLKSVLTQTLKDLEILCIDDGSTDDSADILQEYASKDSRIVIIKQDNQGAGSARNRGIHTAAGEFVFFLDADDYLLDADALEALYMASVKHCVQICGGFMSTDRDGDVIPTDLHREICMQQPEGIKMSYTDYQHDFYYYTYIYSAELLRNNQIEFPPYKRFQDPPFFVKAMYFAETFYIVPKEVYCYRQGHQDYEFGTEKVNDIVKGLTDNLHFSREKGLKKLHVLTYTRLNEFYSGSIICHLKEGNAELLCLLLQANKEVQWEWVWDKQIQNRHLIRPLQYLFDACREKFERSVCDLEKKGVTVFRQNRMFPFDKVDINTKIVLYAAGNVGCSYYEQLKDNPNYELVLWVDRKYDKMQNIGYPVRPVEAILEQEFDYIVIAIEDGAIAESIRTMLRAMGVAESKIIWSLSGI